MKQIAPSARPFWTKRSYILPLVVGTLLNGLIYVALTYRLATKQERLAREHASLTESVAAREKELQGLESELQRIARNEETAKRFWSDIVLPRDPGLAEAIAELDRLAYESGVERGNTSYNFEELEIGLTRASASMPLQGSYFNLVRFINHLERSERFFVVREIRLRRARDEGSGLGLSCDVSFYLKDQGDNERANP
jgi:Tfp pilus assembly protein PilO